MTKNSFTLISLNLATLSYTFIISLGYPYSPLTHSNAVGPSVSISNLSIGILLNTS